MERLRGKGFCSHSWLFPEEIHKRTSVDLEGGEHSGFGGAQGLILAFFSGVIPSCAGNGGGLYMVLGIELNQSCVIFFCTIFVRFLYFCAILYILTFLYISVLLFQS